jgi:UV DNA damage endonuclease
MQKLGYACINMQLNKQGITTNRGMIKKTFTAKGIKYVSELALANVRDFIEIIKWNEKHNIKFFRLSSDLCPWASEYNLEELPDYQKIKTLLLGAGNLIKKYNHRITTHPGPFNVLCSPNEKVVLNTIQELSRHALIFDMIGLPNTPESKINIHCNGVFGDKISAMERFCKNFDRLPDNVKCRLTVENDDKASMYSVKDLMYIHNLINIPITFDYHHHKFNTGDLSEQDALELAISTWSNGITPVVHYSESKSLHENNSKIKPQAHSDYITEYINTYGNTVDIMLECKMKELALIKYRNEVDRLSD